MSKPLEWRLARAFLRCYSLMLFVNVINAFWVTLFGNTIAIPNNFHLVQSISIFVHLIIAGVLLFFSDSIADIVAPGNASDAREESLEMPLDLGVALAGVIILVDGLKQLAGDAAAWFFVQTDPLTHTHPEGLISVPKLAVTIAEVVLGLILFVGAKPLVQGIKKLRSMP